MKRAAEEPAPLDNQNKKRVIRSPISPTEAPSCLQQPLHTGNFRTYHGCSKFEDYELETKLGEGTFG